MFNEIFNNLLKTLGNKNEGKFDNEGINNKLK